MLDNPYGQSIKKDAKRNELFKGAKDDLKL